MGSLKGMLSGVLEMFQVRLELLSVEAREEVGRLVQLVVLATLACVLLGLGVGFLAILITVALWDSHRLLALTSFSVLFLTLGAVVVVLFHRATMQGSRLFESSLAELKQDQDRLKS